MNSILAQNLNLTMMLFCYLTCIANAKHSKDIDP